MKQMIIVWVLVLFTTNSFGRTPSTAYDKLLACLNMKAYETTPTEVSSVLGKPTKVAEGRKTSVWYYKTDINNFTIYWNAQSEKMEKLLFSTITGNVPKPEWDYKYAKCLKLGQAHICDVVKTLGIPKEMTLKENNQQLHYSYKYTVLNVYFRKGTLVNFTLF